MLSQNIGGQGRRAGYGQQQTQVECGIQIFCQGAGVADPPEIGAQQR